MRPVPGALAIGCDVTDEASCRSAIDEAARGLGGIDALVYTPAIGPLARLVDTDAETWRRVFDTNVTGAALITAAVLPHLDASTGTAAYLSSVSASLTPPWPGLGAYIVSKAALDKLVEAWRAEHPGIGFTRLVVGDCGGGEGDSRTEFAEGWDRELAAELGPVWFERGYLSGIADRRRRAGVRGRRGAARWGQPVDAVRDRRAAHGRQGALMSVTTTPVEFDPFSDEFFNDPYEMYRRLRDEAPVYYSEQYGFYALSRFADVLAAHRDWEGFSSAHGIELFLLSKDPEEIRQLPEHHHDGSSGARSVPGTRQPCVHTACRRPRSNP